MRLDINKGRMIAPAIARSLASKAVLAETTGRLTSEQLEIIYQQRWFNLFVPKGLGGLALSLPEGVALEEELACIDGSLGWTVTLCAGASMFAGYLEQTIAQQIFNDPQVCFAGSGRTGTATIVEAGYLINGYWNWATGAPHATIFTANCFIERGGVRLKNEEGNDLVQSFFFLRDEVTIDETWAMMGMKATAGHAFAVKDLQVSDQRTFLIAGAHATIDDPIYQYPFLQFAEATLAANVSGMASHFLSLCGTSFTTKKTKTIRKTGATINACYCFKKRLRN